jgi:hypothetical protein
MSFSANSGDQRCSVGRSHPLEDEREFTEIGDSVRAHDKRAVRLRNGDELEQRASEEIGGRGRPVDELRLSLVRLLRWRLTQKIGA